MPLQSMKENGRRRLDGNGQVSCCEELCLVDSYIYCFSEASHLRKPQNGDLDRKRELHVCALSTSSNSSSTAIAEIIYRWVQPFDTL